MTKKKPGRKPRKPQKRNVAGVYVPYEPTDDDRLKVRRFKAFGLTDEQVAHGMDISVDTLTRHYPKELEFGLSTIIANVASSLYAKALSAKHPQAVAAAIFILKTRGGWSERVLVEDLRDASLQIVLDLGPTNGHAKPDTVKIGHDSHPIRTIEHKPAKTNGSSNNGH